MFASVNICSAFCSNPNTAFENFFLAPAVFVVALILHGLFARSTHCQHGKEVRVHSISSTNSRKSVDCAIEEDAPSRATRYDFFTHSLARRVCICFLSALSKYTKGEWETYIERDEMPWHNIALAVKSLSLSFFKELLTMNAWIMNLLLGSLSWLDLHYWYFVQFSRIFAIFAYGF